MFEESRAGFISQLKPRANGRARALGVALAGFAVVAIAGCGGDGPIGPGQPDPPVISCPASVSVSGPGGPLPVSFPAPTTTGGTLPVRVSCAPASGSVFGVGATPVSCTATDGGGRQAACGLNVTVTAPAFGVSKFVAFGDSVTEGENGRAVTLGQGFIDASSTYPAKLGGLLNGDFPGQGVAVVNSGKSGETVYEASRRLPGVLSSQHPGAVLLLDGYNDLFNACHTTADSPACVSAMDEVVAKMRECIQIARTPSYDVRYVFLSTLTPPGPYVSGPDRRIASDAIVRTNSRLSSMARAEGAIVVDPYRAFAGHESELIEPDGLHPRPAGYQVLAETFFAAIKSSVATTPAAHAID